MTKFVDLAMLVVPLILQKLDFLIIKATLNVIREHVKYLNTSQIVKSFII